jgi:hypothetical protein
MLALRRGVGGAVWLKAHSKISVDSVLGILQAYILLSALSVSWFLVLLQQDPWGQKFCIL